MNEIVARRKNGLAIVWGLLMLLGAGFFAFGAVSFIWTAEDLKYLALSVFILIGGGACSVLGIFELVRFCKTPKLIITYRGGMLYFPYFSCRAEEISQIALKPILYINIFGIASRYRSGTLQIAVGERLFVAYCVADLEGVQRRLLALKQQNQGK